MSNQAKIVLTLVIGFTYAYFVNKLLGYAYMLPRPEVSSVFMVYLISHLYSTVAILLIALPFAFVIYKIKAPSSKTIAFISALSIMPIGYISYQNLMVRMPETAEFLSTNKAIISNSATLLVVAIMLPFIVYLFQKFWPLTSSSIMDGRDAAHPPAH